MAQNRVAKRYAKALLDQAKENKNTEAIFADIQLLLTSFGHEGLAELAKNPVIVNSKKLAVFSQIFKAKVQPETFRIIELVLEKNRESDIVDIAKEFVTLYNQANGITNVRVTTAIELTTELEKAIVDKVTASPEINKINIEKHVDPTIIGGYILEYNHQILDCSIQSSIYSLKRRIGA